MFLQKKDLVGLYENLHILKPSSVNTEVIDDRMIVTTGGVNTSISRSRKIGSTGENYCFTCKPNYAKNIVDIFTRDDDVLFEKNGNILELSNSGILFNIPILHGYTDTLDYVIVGNDSTVDAHQVIGALKVAVKTNKQHKGSSPYPSKVWFDKNIITSTNLYIMSATKLDINIKNSFFITNELARFLIKDLADVNKVVIKTNGSSFVIDYFKNGIFTEIKGVTSKMTFNYESLTHTPKDAPFKVSPKIFKEAVRKASMFSKKNIDIEVRDMSMSISSDYEVFKMNMPTTINGLDYISTFNKGNLKSLAESIKNTPLTVYKQQDGVNIFSFLNTTIYIMEIVND